MVLKDLGYRLELRADPISPLVPEGRLIAVAYSRHKEGDWVWCTRSAPQPRKVKDKAAAMEALEAFAAG